MHPEARVSSGSAGFKPATSGILPYANGIGLFASIADFGGVNLKPRSRRKKLS